MAEIDVLQGFEGIPYVFSVRRERWTSRVDSFAGETIVCVTEADGCATRHQCELLLRERLAEWREKQDDS